MTVTGRFRHQALFYRSEREFLDGTVPFIRAGVEAGEPVLVAVCERKAGLIRSRLDGAADAVRFAEMTALGRNPARIIPAWREFVAEGSGRSMRGIGEPAWPGRSAAELAECDRHESLLNDAFDGLERETFTLLCPYDASALDPHVLEAARRNHPELVDGGGVAPSPGYLSPVVADPFGGKLPEPPPEAGRIKFVAGGLDTVRRFVGAHAADAGLGPHAQTDLVLAVHELAVNSVRYGGGRGSLAVWGEPGALLCQVDDTGRFADPLVGRRRPDCDQTSGRGLWLVNQLCDLVQIRSGAHGSAVRVRLATA